jgi:hypothetical protein
MVWEQNDRFDETHTIAPMKKIPGILFTINRCRVLYDNIQISFNEVLSLVFKPWSFSSSFYSYTFVVNVESPK